MRKILVTLIIPIILFGFISSTSADITTGLELYYSFDQDPQGGPVMDDSGNGHQGTVNEAAYTNEGILGGAYHFDGINDVILVNDDLGFHPKGTISFWMKADAVENWRNPFSTNYASGDANIRFEETSAGGFSMGALGLGTITPFPNGVYEETFTDSLQMDHWYNIVYAWDEVQDYGYLDGILVFSTPHPAADSKVHPDLLLTAGEYRQITLDFDKVAIGNGYSLASERFWKGYIDDVRIYNRVLSEGDVKEYYSYSAQTIPEPATLTLFAGGLLAAFIRRRRERNDFCQE